MHVFDGKKMNFIFFMSLFSGSACTMGPALIEYTEVEIGLYPK